jgi:hypothetical protein
LRRSTPSLEQASACPPLRAANLNKHLGTRTGSVLIIEATMDYTIELVAQAIWEAEHRAASWNSEPTHCKERFREYARNAIKLLGEDIGVLLIALKEATEKQSVGGPRAAV